MKRIGLLLMLPLLAFLSTQASGQDTIVIGKMVKNSQGVTLGKVQNVVLSDRGCVEYIVLSGDFPEGRGRYYPIPWTIVKSSSGDTFVTDIDVAVLKDAPVIDTLNDAALSQWRPKAHNFYVEHKMSASSEKPGGQSSREMTRQREISEKTREKQAQEKRSGQVNSEKKDLGSQQQMTEEKQGKAFDRGDLGKRERDIFKPKRTDESMKERAKRDRDPGEIKSETRPEAGRERSRTDAQTMQSEKRSRETQTDTSRMNPDRLRREMGPSATTD